LQGSYQIALARGRLVSFGKAGVVVQDDRSLHRDHAVEPRLFAAERWRRRRDLLGRRTGVDLAENILALR
jgi:hypothetical protein